MSGSEIGRSQPVLSGSEIGRHLEIAIEHEVFDDFGDFLRFESDEVEEFGEEFHGLAGCDLRISFPHLDFFVRGDNLTDASYDVFYFKSVGNSFFQIGKPRRVTAGVSMEF